MKISRATTLGLALTPALALGLSLAACGGSSSSAGTGTSSAYSAQNTTMPHAELLWSAGVPRDLAAGTEVHVNCVTENGGAYWFNVTALNGSQANTTGQFEIAVQPERLAGAWGTAAACS